MAKSTLFPEIDGPIRFFIDMAPVPQPRQRHAYRPGKGGKKGFVVNYVPKDHPVWTFKELAVIRAREVYKDPPLKGPLDVYVLFLLNRPASLRTPGRVWCDSRVGDMDNFLKALFDALNGIAYEDDCQICQLTTRKFWRSESEQAGVEVMIQELR